MVLGVVVCSRLVVVGVEHVDDSAVRDQEALALGFVVVGAPPASLVAELVVDQKLVFVQDDLRVLVSTDYVNES